VEELMKCLLAVAAVPIILLLAGNPSFADEQGGKVAQEIAEKWAKEFNAANAKGIAALYTTDASFTNAAGTLLGPEAIEKSFESKYQARMEDQPRC
jgi:ketosteroid isomerase-like protein